jgi:hypothetical protein
VTGLELAFRAGGDARRIEGSYTWMIARGSESLEDGLPYYALRGARPVPVGTHALDWDRRHALALSAWTGLPRGFRVAWITRAASGRPWTPAGIREVPADLSLVNTRRFGWTEWSACAMAWSPRSGGIELGLEIENVFDARGPVRASVDGYPHPVANTAYDDYAAFRTATGLGGGAWWDDRDGDGAGEWLRVFDPRLDQPPRSVRLVVRTRW